MAIYYVVGLIALVFGVKLWTILRNPNIPPKGKRMAASIFVFSMLSLLVAIWYDQQ